MIRYLIKANSEVSGGIMFIVPVESYRDGGFFYHYKKAGDYMEIPKRISEMFAQLFLQAAAGIRRTVGSEAI